ncbi:MAG: hypothetical protein ACTS4U_01090 [Candidatus Hodgkinia cicadicola]
MLKSLVKSHETYGFGEFIDFVCSWVNLGIGCLPKVSEGKRKSAKGRGEMERERR